ncbi:MAG TPA: SRPBCC family protein [Solirubrobacterales bacterium]|nr:SRPBCC family protein [Solirubrobacterales bacterium]
MGPVSAEMDVDAPRERVFAILADLSNRPAFCDHFQHEFRLQRIDPVGIGAAARFRVEAPFFKFWMESVLTTVEAPHLIVERGRGARTDRMPVGTAWELSEAGGGMTEVRVSFWTEPEHHLDRLKDTLMPAGWHRRQWRRALARLRDIAEGDAAIERLRVAGASPL